MDIYRPDGAQQSDQRVVYKNTVKVKVWLKKGQIDQRGAQGKAKWSEIGWTSHSEQILLWSKHNMIQSSGVQEDTVTKFGVKPMQIEQFIFF